MIKLQVSDMERPLSILQKNVSLDDSSHSSYLKTAFSLTSLERHVLIFAKHVDGLRCIWFSPFQVIQRFVEAGLTQKWFNDEMDSVHFLTKILSRPELEPFSINLLQVHVLFNLIHPAHGYKS